MIILNYADIFYQFFSKKNVGDFDDYIEKFRTILQRYFLPIPFYCFLFSFL